MPREAFACCQHSPGHHRAAQHSFGRKGGRSSPILAQEHLEAQYQIDPQLFPLTPDYLLKVRGMSMRDAGILHDDLLAVKRLPGGLSETRDGQIVVARLEEDVTVKRFKRDGKKIVLLPENPDFEPLWSTRAKTF